MGLDHPAGQHGGMAVSHRQQGGAGGAHCHSLSGVCVHRHVALVDSDRCAQCAAAAGECQQGTASQNQLPPRSADRERRLPDAVQRRHQARHPAAGAAGSGGAPGLGRLADPGGSAEPGAHGHGGGPGAYTPGCALRRHRPGHPADHPVSDVSEPGSVPDGQHGLDGDADAAQPAHATDPECPRLVHRPAGPAAWRMDAGRGELRAAAPAGVAGVPAGDADPDRADECLR